MKETVVTLTRQWTPAVEADLEKLFTTRFNPEDTILAPEKIIERCQGADILCPTVSDIIDKDLIDRLPKSIRLIACIGVGIENIDLKAAHDRNIIVSNTPGTVVEDTADLTFGLIIATARRFSEADKLLRSNGWKKFALNFMLGHRIHGRTLGIVGMGKIGAAVARRASGFNMNVIYHSRKRKPGVEKKLDLQYVEHLDTLLADSDFVSLHCALTPETRHLINQHSFKVMKSSAILINASRGPVVDETALVTALKENQIAAAGLDVYEFEPKFSKALANLKNTVLLPHLGTASIEARNDMGFQVIDNIRAFLQIGRVNDQVRI